MDADKDRTFPGGPESQDLDQRQDKIIQKIREKESPGFFKRLLALLRSYLGLTVT